MQIDIDLRQNIRKRYPDEENQQSNNANYIRRQHGKKP